MHDLSIRAAILLTLWFVALLYGMPVLHVVLLWSKRRVISLGMLLVVTIFYLRLAFLQGFKGRSDWIMCGIVVFQLLTAGAHSGLVLQQALYGFQSAPIPELYWADQGQPTHLAQTALYLVNNLIADSILVWRLYVVYDKNKLILIPYGVLMSSSTVASIGMLYTLAQGHSLAKLFADALTGWSDTSWALSITTQLSASCLIALRIWTVQNRSLLARSRAASRCMPIIWMILESGAILSFATVILLALYTRHAVAGGVLVGICGQLVSLVPTSILLRVSLSRVAFGESSDLISLCAVVNSHDDGESMLNTTSRYNTAVHIQQSTIVRQDPEVYYLREQYHAYQREGRLMILSDQRSCTEP